MNAATSLDNYGYADGNAAHTHGYLFPTLLKILQDRPVKPIFELGCGNGTTAAMLGKHGYTVSGVDPSSSGIAIAQRLCPDTRLEVGSSEDDLRARFGRFDTVLSLEVIEHVYSPGHYAKTIDDLLEPGGIAIISTPYHSYLKNLALAASGKMESHFTALWEGGHIKFWSRATIRRDRLLSGRTLSYPRKIDGDGISETRQACRRLTSCRVLRANGTESHD
jgi:2-polyprenyl-6-hydroxyphenyl methylase/3-demethylubiquinone-9 3-methyltransferase